MITMENPFSIDNTRTIIDSELGRLKHELRELNEGIENVTEKINTARLMMNEAIKLDNDAMLDFYSDYWEKQNDIYQDLLTHMAAIMPIIRDLQKVKKEENHG